MFGGVVRPAQSLHERVQLAVVVDQALDIDSAIEGDHLRGAARRRLLGVPEDAGVVAQAMLLEQDRKRTIPNFQQDGLVRCQPAERLAAKLDRGHAHSRIPPCCPSRHASGSAPTGRAHLL